MNELLEYFRTIPDALAWLIFLAENILLTVVVLLTGKIILRRTSVQATLPAYPRRAWLICAVTNVLNTVVTYAGLWLWKHQFIVVGTAISWTILPDFLLLFFAMDLLMYLFHFLIHKTFLYRAIHQLHHQSIHPRPIDLFVLHPVETLSFGALWLLLLMCYAFNMYAILLYLTVNLVFGLMGHLGIEPLPTRLRQLPVLKYLGTSTFHHDHHEDPGHNFGFYTSCWDRLFGTGKRRG